MRTFEDLVADAEAAHECAHKRCPTLVDPDDLGAQNNLIYVPQLAIYSARPAEHIGGSLRTGR
jgi:hypothetical protein